jgi:molybdate transport system substrate-binding protein
VNACRAAAVALLGASVAHVGGPAACTPASGPGTPQALLFAAASLEDAANDALAGYPAAVRLNVAGSNALARQLEASGREAVFVSADPLWMDHLEQRGLVKSGTRRDLLSNRLVVIAHVDSPVDARSPLDLAGPAVARIALADPEAVPAGRYAREWLRDHGVWAEIAPKVVPTADVRAALALVAARVDIVGVVYRTDAAASPSVRVLLDVAGEAAPTVRYVAAIVGTGPATAEARALLEHLSSPSALDAFEARGFLPPGAP